MSNINAQESTILAQVLHELQCAQSTHPPMNSGHEGYAVIKEELDELWDEIKLKRQNVKNMRKEALQVAAMGLRFIIDVCDGD